jgi:hypothetical protein
MDLSQDLVRTDDPAAREDGAATDVTSTSLLLPNSRTVAASLPTDHRREPRFPMTAKVRVGWIESNRQMRHVTARAIDVSEEGLGVWVKEPMPVGGLVQVDLSDSGVSAIGHVRYCRISASGCRAGFEVMRCFPSYASESTSE